MQAAGCGQAAYGSVSPEQALHIVLQAPGRWGDQELLWLAPTGIHALVYFVSRRRLAGPTLKTASTFVGRGRRGTGSAAPWLSGLWRKHPGPASCPCASDVHAHVAHIETLTVLTSR